MNYLNKYVVFPIIYTYDVALSKDLEVALAQQLSSSSLRGFSQDGMDRNQKWLSTKWVVSTDNQFFLNILKY